MELTEQLRWELDVLDAGCVGRRFVRRRLLRERELDRPTLGRVERKCFWFAIEIAGASGMRRSGFQSKTDWTRYSPAGSFARLSIGKISDEPSTTPMTPGAKALISAPSSGGSSRARSLRSLSAARRAPACREQLATGHQSAWPTDREQPRPRNAGWFWRVDWPEAGRLSRATQTRSISRSIVSSWHAVSARWAGPSYGGHGRGATRPVFGNDRFVHSFAGGASGERCERKRTA